MKILIVDDERAIVDLIKINLELEGFETVCCYNGNDAIVLANAIQPDIILLDIMMPGLNGLDVCKRLQNLSLPIIMLTAKNNINDKLLGLEYGADDYITKPFDSRELIARIKVILRRSNMTDVKEDFTLTVGPIKIHQAERRVTLNEIEIPLTPKEYELLYLLCENPKKVFSRDNILESVWGFEYYGDTRTVDIHIQRLRKKLGEYSGIIKTVFSIGYKLEVK